MSQSADRPSLEPLFTPRSIAVVGASAREGSFGRSTLEQTMLGFTGKVYPINPKADEILGLKCFPSLAELPAPPDLAILAVPNPLVEEQMQLAVETGVRSAAIFASLYMEGDTDPPLPQRIGKLARDANMPLVGGNCMGFYHPARGVSGSWYKVGHQERGNIGLITHSGTLFITLCANDPRYTFSLVVSPGQELALTAADYMHYMLDEGETRVITLFLETVRDPSHFVAALKKANKQDVPVVAIKVGRTEKSALLAKSHSGAITGDDAAYEALFEKYGVARAESIDELMTTTLVLQHKKRPAKGGLAAVLDSGGARGLMIDLAAQNGVPWSQISKDTEAKLEASLEYGLPPVNPVDAWGTGHEPDRIFSECLKAVTDDPDTGMSVMMVDLSADGDPFAVEFTRAALAVAAASEKPVLLGMHWSQLKSRGFLAKLQHEHGMPMLEGTLNTILAAKHAFGYRDFKALPALDPPAPPAKAIIDKWRRRLGAGGALEEYEGLEMLSDFGIPVPRFAITQGQSGAVTAAGEIGFPVALKTAKPGVLHKTELDGVRLGLATSEAVAAAYKDINSRLGSPRMIVASMAEPGTELALGLVQDAQFGPVMVVGAGGTLIEVLRDRRVALPPIDSLRATRLLDRLKSRALLDGHRERPAADTTKLAETIARFSVLCATLGDLIAELDVNPLIVGARGPVAVDAIVIPR
jgi:acyl-CoA synthetase (NDP forming)